MFKQRRELPIYDFFHTVVDTVHKNQAVVLVGETGSGKTTRKSWMESRPGAALHPWWCCARQRCAFQTGPKCVTVFLDQVAGWLLHGLCSCDAEVVQYLMQSGFGARGQIAVTQPRRVAATTVSQRVAVEMGETLGGVVGYTIRFKDVTSPETKLKFLTDGMLLR